MPLLLAVSAESLRAFDLAVRAFFSLVLPLALATSPFVAAEIRHMAESLAFVALLHVRLIGGFPLDSVIEEDHDGTEFLGLFG